MVKQIIAALIMGALAFTPSGLAQTTNAPKPNPEGEAKPHVLREGDKLDLKVYREPDLDVTQTIDKQGMINLQLVGPVKMEGLTVAEARQKIHDLYAKDYLVNPSISLELVDMVKERITILGEVMKPGPIEIPADTSLNLLEAISMAGGYTRMGSPSKITVMRMVNGQPTVYKLNADAMIKDRNVKPFELQPKDVVKVGEKLF